MLKTPPVWDQLEAWDRKIIIAVCFDGSAESARKNLRLSKNQFNKRWLYLEPIYQDLLNFLPTFALRRLNIWRGWVAQPPLQKKG